MNRVAPHLWNAIRVININQRWPLAPLALNALQAEDSERPARLLITESDHKTRIGDAGRRDVHELAADLMTTIIADVEVEDCEPFSKLAGEVAVCAVIAATPNNENEEHVSQLRDYPDRRCDLPFSLGVSLSHTGKSTESSDDVNGWCMRQHSLVGRRKSSKCRRLLPAHDFRAGAIPNREVIIKPAMQKNCTGVSGAQRPAALAELSPGRRVVLPPTTGGLLARRGRHR